jgi:hypothetical protein
LGVADGADEWLQAASPMAAAPAATIAMRFI